MSCKIDIETILGFRTDIDKAYAAGFFDGEGCVNFRMNKGPNGKLYPMLHVSIGQKDRRVLEWFRYWFAGSIYSYSKKVFFQWSIVGTRAEKFLLQVQPLLKVKDGQVTAALERYYAGRKFVRERGELRKVLEETSGS